MAGDDKTVESAEPVVELLDELECQRLIAAGGVGRIGYTGRFGPTILPVNYALDGEAIVFRTMPGSRLDVGQGHQLVAVGGENRIASARHRGAEAQFAADRASGGVGAARRICHTLA